MLAVGLENRFRVKLSEEDAAGVQHGGGPRAPRRLADGGGAVRRARLQGRRRRRLEHATLNEALQRAAALAARGSPS